jgi:shikimate dehydrogenase
MREFGLIGYPLGHSFSKRYFSEKFDREGLTDCHYELFPLPDLEALPALLDSRPDLRGFNVTIPWKSGIIPYLNELDETARAVGAVNTVAVRGGQLSGYNTDVWGFARSLEGFLPAAFEGPALILGTGGASRAVQYVLAERGIEYALVSRKPGPGKLTYAAIDEACLRRHSLIVQTTPLGMSPDLESLPQLPYAYLSSKHYLYDLVYNPEETAFLRRGKERGARVKNGLEMLYLQAEKAWEIWNALT